MHPRSALALVGLVTLALAGCATPTAIGPAGGPAAVAPAPTSGSESIETAAPTESARTDPEAREQAQAWLEQATLPPGAVPRDADVAHFSSYTGWPCGPVAELTAYWSIPDTTVSEATNWLQVNPTGDLVTTAVAPLPDDPEIRSAIVGYIPEAGAQEGVVYTVERLADGVAVRAEIAAQTAAATCPELPNGGEYGPPGQG